MLVKLNGKKGEGKYAIVDDDDYEKVSKIVWNCDTEGYAISNFGLRMHRFIMDPPSGLVVDHINHDKLDNRKSNLRVCTTFDNNQNRPRKRSRDVDLPSYVYRYFVKGKFRGYMFRCDKGGECLKKCRFKTVEEAVSYRDNIFKEKGFA